MSVRKVAVVVALCAATAVVAVTPVKIRSLLPTCGAGYMENPSGDGMAKLKFKEFVPEFGGPGIEIHVHLHHFKPNTVYGIVMQTVSAEIDSSTAVTTNCAGNANWNVTIPSSQPADPVNSLVVIYRDCDGDNFWTPDEERAMGMPD